MPDDKWLQFQNVRHSYKVPFVVYADFECLCLPVSRCEPTSSSAYTERYQKHEPISFCYYIAYAHGFYKDPVTYRGPNASKHFMMLLKQEAEEIFQIYQNPKEMIELTSEDVIAHENSNSCYICKIEFTISDYKVKYHDHMQG
ncbi:hypothetical protein AVEN_56711-1 [Araneus ventricosus]|uniref:DNA-directed DNA polymerase n=1 Tax=Araneus ventricosus TaxID=182803 RepID=A0A4Y2QT35_ARAVE|nr:hypothetical protein AVEN_56711-1 [Araneus ventricosus]